eukprot:NODE_57_length_25931_cov_0.351037.p10 type:complete len:383 gc:universal NODE_57_length_25931_cov_0.351037:3195-2047(-)
MLDLSWKKLEEIPTLELIVQELNISNNSITKIPSLFTTLNSLHTVDLSNNAIVSVPAMPRSLKILNLSGNRLTESSINEMLVKSCKSAWNLEKLWLTSNDIKEFPIEIVRLTSLDFLSISNNKIRDIPIQIRSLEKLKFLGLSNNLITDAEVILMLLPQLHGFGISGNPLKEQEIQVHRMRHKIKVVRVSQDKPASEHSKDQVLEKLEVLVSRKGTKLLKKKNPSRRPMTLGGLSSFSQTAPDNEPPTSSFVGKILEEEDSETTGKKGNPGFSLTPLKATASMSAFDFRDNIDSLVEYYFNSDESLLEGKDAPHRVDISHRHSKTVSEDKAKEYMARRSKSENELSGNSNVVINAVQISFTNEPIVIVPKNPQYPVIQIDFE